MKKSLSELDRIEVIINSEKKKYHQAIKDNQTFANVKVTFMHIKKLQQEADLLKGQITEEKFRLIKFDC
jgi:hypothetical protein